MVLKKLVILGCVLLVGCATVSETDKWGYMARNIYLNHRQFELYNCADRVRDLSKAMQEEGVSHYIVHGYYNHMWDGYTKHVWIEFKGEILDPAIGWVGEPNEFWVEEWREKY